MKSLSIGVFLALISVSVSAESDLITNLKAKNISVFDYGVSELAKAFTRVQFTFPGHTMVSPGYSEEKDKFVIKINSFGTNPENEEVANKRCNEAVNTVRSSLGVSATIGSTEPMPHSYLGSFFHIESVREAKKLDDMTIIEGFFSIKDQDKFIHCSGSLVSSETTLYPAKKHVR